MMEFIIKVLRFLLRGGTDSRQIRIRLAGLIAIVVFVWLAVRLTQNPGQLPPLSEYTMPQRGDVTVIGAIEVGGSVSGTLNQGERHGWTFTGERGQYVDLRVFGEWDSTLELIPPNGRESIAIDFSSGGGSAAMLCGQFLRTAGEYTAIVSGYLGLPDRDFGEYELSLTGRPASEPVPVAYGDTVSGRVETCDGDFYLIDVEQGDTLEVTLTPEAGADLVARLLTANSARDMLVISRGTTDAAGRAIDVLTAEFTQNAQMLINVSRRIDHPPADYVMTISRP